MEQQAQGGQLPSLCGPPQPLVQPASLAGPAARREKKRPPKSSSSQFFSLLSHGASHVQKLVGAPPDGGADASSLEAYHLLDPTHLDEHDAPDVESDGGAGAGVGMVRRRRGSVTSTSTSAIPSRYREESRPIEVVPKTASVAATRAAAMDLTASNRASPPRPSVSEPVLSRSIEHQQPPQKAASEQHVGSADVAVATTPAHRRARLVKQPPLKPKEEFNRSYFFLRELSSDSDSSDSGEEDEDEDKDGSDKETQSGSSGRTERRRQPCGEGREYSESAHKEAEELSQGLGEDGDGDGEEADSKTEEKDGAKVKRKHKREMSGWVMKKVLVFMGGKDKVKGLVTRNKQHRSKSHQRRSRRARASRVLVANTDGEEEMFEMVDLHNPSTDDLGDLDDDDDPEEGEVDEAEAKKARYEQAILFLIALCRALHKYGAPAHRLEYNLHRASESLGVEASFAVMPSLVLISVGPEDHRRAETHIIRSSQSLNCAKLFWTDDLIARLTNNEIDLPDAVVELASINRRKPLYPLWLTLLSFGVCSGACAPLFYGGGWIELAVSFGLGLMTGVLNWLADTIEPLGILVPAVTAILCAFLTRIFIEYVHPICYLPTVLASIVWMLPGLSITISITELATGNMISGTTRIFSAIVTTLQLGFGMTLGMKMVMWTNESHFIEVRDSVSCDGIGGPWTIPLFLCVSITFNLLLAAHPRQWGIMMVTALLSLTVTEVTSYYGYFSDEIASAMAAFAVGAVGNIHARISGHPAIVSIISGVLLLVPGSMAVKGVGSLMEDDVVSGIQFGFSMLTIALSICVGLLTANLFNLGKKHLGF